ncbi:6-phospho-beta-glucosidase [Pseudarthrobacter sp. NIBRBAC000502770]|uniref:family 4 glycosyl hydrolase n=1 Tax=Pseudarthrobacter sp. NIBRBAC000502770 TaxID=2590785 RepID=UPI0011402D6F|nr:6-phospho-beta-glucosidase [Pseudarthrobacter sp. NIBRBAC000502770]QDG89133.1 6-phospho-beta-glucosidase [Pseudarthrobacter sp. NIBRBAC000502770]
MRLLIAGGGGFRVPLIYRALVSGPFSGLVTELVLHDVDPARLDAVTAVLRSMPTGQGAHLPVDATTDLSAALPGTSMVFAAIRPGGTAGRVADEKVAQDLGLLGQETTGAGGISYALRTIPHMVDLARLMRERCPDAWLVNFTNPAGMVTEALRPVMGNRVIGICDSAGGLVQRAARAAGVPLPAGRLDGVGYYGLNHLGWLYRLESGGRDMLPGLLADTAALQSFEEGRLFPQPFLAGLGLLPNEYLYYYYQGEAARQAMQAMAGTRGQTIHSQQQELYPRLAAAGPDAYRLWEAARRSREEGYLAEARGAGEPRSEEDLAGGGYERVALAAMRALAGGGGTQLVLNTVNALPAAPAPGRAGATPSPPQPAIPGLPADAVVEVPCTVTEAGAVPLPQQTPAEPQLGLLRRVKEVERLVVVAAGAGNREAAVEAFARHPLVDSADLAVKLMARYERAFPDLGKMWEGGGR